MQTVKLTVTLKDGSVYVIYDRSGALLDNFEYGPGNFKFIIGFVDPEADYFNRNNYEHHIFAVENIKSIVYEPYVPEA